MITPDQFQQLFPDAPDADQWCQVIEELLPRYNIDTPERVSAFLSQCAVETGGWRKFEENMNYSADRIMQVWPRIFDRELALQCHRNPEMVGNHAYANRMGNGGPETGDGWKYRGRGPIHLTGRRNYTMFAETFDDPSLIIETPDVVAEDKHISLISALWFWDINNLNDLADVRQITKLSRKVNGGDHGLPQRIALFQSTLDLIG